LEKEEVHLKK